MARKMTRSLINTVAFKATEALWGKKLITSFKEVHKSLGVQMMDYLQNKYPECKKVIAVADGYYSTFKRVYFSISSSRKVPVPEAWDEAWDSLSVLFQDKKERFVAPWSSFELPEEFPKKRDDYPQTIPVSKEALFMKTIKPFGDMLLEAAGFYKAVQTTLYSVGTVLRVQKKLPHLMKFFPKEFLLDFGQSCSSEVVSKVNQALKGVS